ncbi:MAG: hypothetical protein ACFFA6_15745 [Promethearchaeota archaeon]
MCALFFDYSLPVDGPSPPGYPTKSVPDTHTTESFAVDFAARRQAFLAHVRRNPAPGNLKAPYYELARLAAGAAPHEGVFRAAFDYIDQRRDCADFVLHGVLRLLYQFGGDPALSPDLLDRARRTMLGFKYWPDEPGIDSLCTWTENHQILFAAGAYLAGQLYPDEVFTNSGQTGREKMTINRHRILRWLDLRFRTGFSEWLSHVYYDEDLTPLVNLVDFCRDAEIRQRAAMVVDLLLLDMALNSFQGVFGSTHGRSYENSKKWAAEEATADAHKLLFGTGIFAGVDNMSATCLALSQGYYMPRVLYDIANDRDRPEMVNRQRMGIRLAEAERWGLGFQDFEDGMVFLSLEAYAHPCTINLTMDMFDAFRWWDSAFFGAFKARRALIDTLRRLRLLPLLARLFEWDVTRNTREEVNIHTYRTPNYMLSAAQDYRPGYGGDQQHVWQATLGPNAVCFTTHPPRRVGRSPNYWTGSGTLPRVAQVENVALVVYDINTRPALYVSNRLLLTHAWLPRDQFDEVVERDGWLFARRGEGYLALRSQHPYHWQTEPGEDQGREVVVPGKRNVWVCELGRRAEDGAFEAFIERICQAALTFGDRRVAYDSPSQGLLEFGWTGPLRQRGAVVSLGDYARYDNPYVQADFPPERIEVRCGEHWLRLGWPAAARQASEFV